MSEAAPIRRPRRKDVPLGVVGETGDVGPVGIHHIHLDVAVPIRLKGDAAPIRKPHRNDVDRGVVGEAGDVGAVGIHHIDLKVAVPLRVEGDAPRNHRGGVVAAGNDKKHQRDTESKASHRTLPFPPP